MFSWLGRIISKTWLIWLAAWIVLWAGAWVIAPRWKEVAQDGEFQFLPRGIPSQQGNALLERAFGGGHTDSSVVLVVSRDRELTDADHRFITQKLQPALEQLARDENKSRADQGRHASASPPFVTRILTEQDKEAGALLVSGDRRASLVVLALTSDFMVRRNLPFLDKLDDLIKHLQREGAVPGGLRIDLSGSAEMGRDMMRNESESARAIQSWTIWLVIILLLVFYRAPLIAFIPLLTLYIAVSTSIRILLLIAQAGYIELFRGLDVYTTVVAYAAGVDYNLFLISRYQEEVQSNDEQAGDALARAIGKIGGALTASAATVICGIGTLMIAQFGKFREAGLTISFSLFVMLCATLTLTPALLRLSGRWAFWPWGLRTTQDHDHGDRPAWRRWLSGMSSPFQTFWSWIGGALEKHPGTIWLVTVLVLSPLAGYAILNYDNINYGLIQGLPKNAPSVRGTKLLTEHYPAGDSGPLTLVIRNDRVDFARQDGLDLIRAFTDRLKQRRRELKIADIRSVVDPLGITPAAQRALDKGGAIASVLAEPLVLGRAIEHYVSNTKELDHHATKLSIVPEFDPYTRAAIQDFNILEAGIKDALPEGLKQGTELYLTGATASFRDLKVVAEQDRHRINLVVTASVLIVLILLLRRIAIPIYLILSVLFGYLVTLGAAYAVFGALERPSFPGLDWTVPIFLFTVLVAVGEDYNIILVTRIDEEQEQHGPVRGVAEALAKTGGIISGCGFIMAGTFSSLAFGGSLARMYQLGFALTFGVLLDTFVVRPVLVPAYIIFVNRMRLGRLGALLGAKHEQPVAARR